MIEKTKQLINFIKEWFWALPTWKRAVFTSIAGALGGSSVIGFFNKYALYYHALCQNFRIPVEGVEYLNLAVTLVSFAFILTSILGSILIYALINLIADFFAKRLAGKKENEEKTTRLKKIIVYIQASLPVFYIASILIKLYYKDKELEQSITIVILISILLITSVGLIFSQRKKSSRKTFSLVIVAGGILLIIASLFNQRVYSSFLMKIKYGGHIPIEIEYRKADNTETKIEGLLLIRTSKSITLKSINSNNTSEIPIDRVSKIVFINK
ncbi:hypothetical protein [Psychroserpens mesophilus]|uniref:hypothetical protein n=1 Tax=Psychroserpens mesophilus TaxID=325473 RepID=UPI00058EC322|nr:hypothetical protein [Psychroserpens mesophilus]